MSHKSKVIWVSNVDGTEHSSEEAVIGYDAAYSEPAQAWIEKHLVSTGRFKTESGLSGAIKAHTLFISAYEIAKSSGELDLESDDSNIDDVPQAVVEPEGADTGAIEEEQEEEQEEEPKLTAKQKRNLKTAEKLKAARQAELDEQAENGEPEDSADAGAKAADKASGGEEDPDAWMYE